MSDKTVEIPLVLLDRLTAALAACDAPEPPQYAIGALLGEVDRVLHAANVARALR